MDPQRILYMTPDNPLPTGGVRVIYRHVQTLARNGFPAFVVHNKPNFKPTWFPTSDVPTLFTGNHPTLTRNDTLIVPEIHASWLQSMRDVPSRKVVLVQNHFAIYDGLKDAQSWHDLGITHAIATSGIIANYIQTVLKFPSISLVHLGIDHTLFRPGPKKQQIACMPRKMPSAYLFIRKTYDRLAGQGALPFEIIGDMTEHQTAQALSESSIFLSLSWLEGLGLPPLEAMASGCIIAGFHGNGGKEYATPQNGLWCEGDDGVSAAKALHKATTLSIKNDPQIARMTSAAQQTASQYNFPNEEKDLLNFARTISTPSQV